MPNINSSTISMERKLLVFLNQYPQPPGFSKRLIIYESIVYTEEKVFEEFVKNEKAITKIRKLGRLNNGFTFFNDRNYSTRLIVKRGRVLVIELYIRENDKVEPLELEIPIIYEERFSKPGSPETLLNAFQNYN